MSKPSTSEALLGCGAAILLLPVALLLGGTTLQWLWLWFIVPTFAAKPLTLAGAIGIDLVFSVLQTQPFRTKESGETVWDALAMAVSRVVVWPLSLLGIGLIVRRFM